MQIVHLNFEIFVPQIVQFIIVNLSHCILMLPSLKSHPMLPSPFSLPHALVSMLPYPFSRPHNPVPVFPFGTLIPIYHPPPPFIMLRILLYFSFCVVMLLGWEHWDGSVRFNTPLHCPVPNAATIPILLSPHYPIHSAVQMPPFYHFNLNGSFKTHKPILYSLTFFRKPGRRNR